MSAAWRRPRMRTAPTESAASTRMPIRIGSAEEESSSSEVLAAVEPFALPVPG